MKQFNQMWKPSFVQSQCSHKALQLHALKTAVEMLRENPVPLATITLCSVVSSCFLGNFLTKDLKWELNWSPSHWKCNRGCASSTSTSSSIFQRQSWFTSTQLSVRSSSHPPSPRGTPHPLPGTKEDCSISFVLQRRWLVICSHLRPFTLGE